MEKSKVAVVNQRKGIISEAASRIPDDGGDPDTFETGRYQENQRDSCNAEVKTSYEIPVFRTYNSSASCDVLCISVI